MRITNAEKFQLQSEVTKLFPEANQYKIEHQEGSWRITFASLGLYFDLKLNNQYVVTYIPINKAPSGQVSYHSFDQVKKVFLIWLTQVHSELKIEINILTEQKDIIMDEKTTRLFELRNKIITSNVTQAEWKDLGVLTNCSDIIEDDPRLLRSLSWGDDDYSDRARVVLSAILERDSNNYRKISAFLKERVLDNLSTTSLTEYSKSVHDKLKNSEVFKIPTSTNQSAEVSVMMPFSNELNPTYQTIQDVCKKLNLSCLRADNIWQNSAVIQDIFDLIYKSEVVIADFTGKNPNVFYEVGIAHTLGKVVIPISQSLNDVPFDLQHHRVLIYLPNDEGRSKMADDLKKRLDGLFQKETF